MAKTVRSYVTGREYHVRLTDGTWVVGRYVGPRVIQGRDYGGFIRTRTVTHYLFVNTRTGRQVEIKSRVKIRETSKS